MNNANQNINVYGDDVEVGFALDTGVNPNIICHSLLAPKECVLIGQQLFNQLFLFDQ